MSEFVEKIQLEDKVNYVKRKKSVIALFYVFSFLIPAVFMVCIYFSLGIGYGKSNTVLILELKDQYMPFIVGIRYLMREPFKVLCNHNFSFDVNYLGIIAPFVTNPLNLITLFWKIDDIADAIFFLEVLKVGLCGLTFFCFLNGKEKDRLIRFSDLLFSICYALSAYVIAYSFCLVYIDAVILLPVVILGIHYMLQGKKGVLTLFGMFGILICNYHMFLPVFIFAFIYLLLYLWIHNGEDSKRVNADIILYFVINTLLAVGFSMPLVLPSLYNLLQNKQLSWKESSMPVPFFSHFIEMVRKLLPSQYDGIRQPDTPYIYCTLLVCALFVAFLLQKRSIKEKCAPIILGAVVILGFFIPSIDGIWNGFCHENHLTYKYAFLLTFLLILTAREAFGRIKIKTDTAVILCFVVAAYSMVELMMNGTAIVGGIMKEVNYENVTEVQFRNELIKPLAKQLHEKDTFYRARNTLSGSGINVNASFIYDFNGTDFYPDSVKNGKKNIFTHLGAGEQNGNLNIGGFTPLMDSLMGIDYLISNAELGEDYIVEKSEKITKLYKNPYALSLGFCIPTENKEPSFNENPFVNQVNFLSYLGNSFDVVFKRLPRVEQRFIQEDEILLEVSFTCLSDNPVYYYLSTDKTNNDQVALMLDDVLIKSTRNEECNIIEKLGAFQAGEKHTFKVFGKANAIKDLYIYEFENEAYKNAMDLLKLQQLENVSLSKNRISATVDAKQDTKLFVSLMYDEGYKIYVDGVKTPYTKELDSFIGLFIEQGKHTIEIVYIPKGLKVGTLLFVLSCVGTLVYYMIFRKDKFKK